MDEKCKDCGGETTRIGKRESFAVVEGELCEANVRQVKCEVCGEHYELLWSTWPVLIRKQEQD